MRIGVEWRRPYGQRFMEAAQDASNVELEHVHERETSLFRCKEKFNSLSCAIERMRVVEKHLPGSIQTDGGDYWIWLDDGRLLKLVEYAVELDEEKRALNCRLRDMDETDLFNDSHPMSGAFGADR